ncbi:GNAT family N-acetyltransferase [Natrarchaeobius chitinivorans]|uniref:GNAT family N-acetyltransferase n=1 Tax=Natrarchaeobius chitinivorans TaxID=1679083 RepID=A0A3N6MJC2_NATCH|nr:GNAT family N-acetyltransferase [Natrarchaeobius chitinivorans]RQG95891.1 GNAT family N-acetyltransferase [Natrarchaeobius chitinivorans]
MTEYRPIPDRREVFHEYASYAFSPESGVRPYDPDEHETPRANLGVRRGVFARDGDDRPRAVCKHYWFEGYVRGDRYPITGLASVATPPENRRSGDVRRLIAHSLEEYRDRGTVLTVLWPFNYRFYRRFGWETAHRIVTHEFDPAVLSFAKNAGATGTFSRVDPDEFETLEDAYAASPPTLAFDRTEGWWRHRIFEGYETDPFVYAYERDGSVVGYLIYQIDGEWGEKTMSVSELVAVDHEALLALLGFCYDHDSQVEDVELRVPSEFPLRDLSMDPEEIETTVENGPMVRIVDVETALAALAQPDANASITLEIEDPLADWNDGRFRLETANDRTVCERVDESVAVDPDATVDVAALSQMVVGSRSASALERTGRLEVGDSDVVAALEEAFPETQVYLGDRF